MAAMDLVIEKTTEAMAFNGLSYEGFFVFLILCIAFIFCIQDYRVGLMTLFILSVCGFIWFSLGGLSTYLFLILIFFSIVLLSLSIFISRSGGRIVS